MLVAKQYGMDLPRLAAIMETCSGRNFFTQGWDRGKASLAYFARSLDLGKVVVDLCTKDLRHAQELARQGNVSCPLLDQIADAVSTLSYEEIPQRWGALT
jgi:3-hydroxyisobutyrate dehydrogenase-like beta-hydroxyacid dehydrogenase